MNAEEHHPDVVRGKLIIRRTKTTGIHKFATLFLVGLLAQHPLINRYSLLSLLCLPQQPVAHFWQKRV